MGKKIRFENESRAKIAGLVTDCVLFDNRLVVMNTDGGFICCVVHDSPWCDHVENVIKSGMDSEFLFQDIRKDDGFYAIVPIFPNKFNIYAEVYFDRVNATMATATVWNIGNDVISAPKDDKSLGMVCEGDGRMQLRQMILAWLATDLSGELPQPGCTAMSHTWRRRAEITEDLKDKTSALAHIWCIRWYTKCYRCLQEEGASKKFDDDLLPR